MRLLIIEDEEHLAAGLKLNLELEGYSVDVAQTAKEASTRILMGRYNAIVLDVMLPDLDGFALCKRLRDAGNFTPVIMLTARNAAADRVRGLEVGADDYMVKPFDLPELLARVRSMLRRQEWSASHGAVNAQGLMEVGRGTVNFESLEAFVDGDSLKLTRLEFDLLRHFATNPQRVISRDELLEEVWKLRIDSGGRTIDNFIGRLRKHFEIDPQNPVHFVAVRGAGYKYVP